MFSYNVTIFRHKYISGENDLMKGID
ncbi:hypothetical protein XBJ1_3519 [Xenorhabdus bovienii SS-2004]|uniref:Uncharacterized protein n=1 Tax=Xenorhabdus bovienii (strain SS-2004) TaxID=406818 RepID=D3V4Q8_XENBS|nr:hypothetical protein XBJ1_3519 [Xenorhabdus bovienii SS-2004]